MGLPVAAFGTTAGLSRDPALVVSRVLTEGDALCDDWMVLHTPGHASDHICFVQESSGEAVVGDMVAAVGTIIIDPPDGHMGTYLAELARLQRLSLNVAVPAHGAPIGNPSAHFQAYIAHRLAREARVSAALTDTPQSVAVIAARSYPELDRHLLPLAERACLAHLEHLFEHEEARWVAGPDLFTGERPWLGPGHLWRNAL